jgi:hypothetical protein
LFLAAGLVIALGARSSGAAERSASADDIALAMVVESAERPEEAAAIEVRPYRALLRKVRVGPGEKTLRPLAKVGIGDDELARDPEGFRGKVVHEFGILGEVTRVDAPGVGRYDRDIVYAGLVGTPQGRFFAFRALRRPTDAPLYPGDRIWVSGYFLKMLPVDDAAREHHRLPLVVSPWPTYTGKWWPAGVVGKMAGDLGFPLPSHEVAHETVMSRLVIDIRNDNDGATAPMAVDGVPMPRADILAEMMRSAAAHPGRTMVVRTPSGEAGRASRALLLDAGVERVVYKPLPVGAPADDGRNGQ